MKNFQVNPMELIMAIRNGQNPEQLMLGILEQNMSSSNPMMGNLLMLAKNNNTPEIEKIARNIARERGIDYDKEFEAFKKSWGLK
jgi:hypothetical protein